MRTIFSRFHHTFSYFLRLRFYKCLGTYGDLHKHRASSGMITHGLAFYAPASSHCMLYLKLSKQPRSSKDHYGLHQRAHSAFHAPSRAPFRSYIDDVITNMITFVPWNATCAKHIDIHQPSPTPMIDENCRGSSGIGTHPAISGTTGLNGNASHECHSRA